MFTTFYCSYSSYTQKNAALEFFLKMQLAMAKQIECLKVVFSSKSIINKNLKFRSRVVLHYLSFRIIIKKVILLLSYMPHDIMLVNEIFYYNLSIFQFCIII
jgi:hypothetical protein